MAKGSALVALALLVAACGGDTPSAEVDSTGSTGAVETTTTVEATDDGVESFAAFFGYGSEDPAESEARYREQEAEIQEMIRVCMAEQGFEYIPVLPPDEAFFFDDTGPEDYAAQYGFGITTWFGNEEEFAGPDIEWEDPNWALVEEMSEGEQEAYYEALYGSQEEQEAAMEVEVDPETGEEIFFSEGFGFGCEGEAYEAVYGSMAGAGQLWEELQPELEAMNERVLADPRIVDLNAEWSVCMADKGYDYESEETMYEQVYEDFDARFQEIVPGGGYVDPFEGWTEDEIESFFAEKSDEEIEAFFEAAQTEPEYDEEALAALQQEEIDLAVAAAECSSGYWEVYQEVSAEYEAEFIASHREQMEAIREAEGGR